MNKTAMLALGVIALGLVTVGVSNGAIIALPDSTVLDTATVWSGRAVKLGFLVPGQPYVLTNVRGDSVRINGVPIYPGFRATSDTEGTPFRTTRTQAMYQLHETTETLKQRLTQTGASRAKIIQRVAEMFEEDKTNNAASWVQRVWSDSVTVWVMFKPERGTDSLAISISPLRPVRTRTDVHRVRRSVLQGYARRLREGQTLVLGDAELEVDFKPSETLYGLYHRALDGSMSARSELHGHPDVADWVIEQLDSPVDLSPYLTRR